jgi:hypothetical protein
MKYIKTFERFNLKKFWLVPTDERFVKSLKDLGCSKSFIKYQSNNKNIQLTKYVYVGIGNRVSTDDWSWAPDDIGEKEFRNYTYMGTINLTEDEEMELKAIIHMSKYNL